MLLKVPSKRKRTLQKSLLKKKIRTLSSLSLLMKNLRPLKRKMNWKKVLINQLTQSPLDGLSFKLSRQQERHSKKQFTSPWATLPKINSPDPNNTTHILMINFQRVIKVQSRALTGKHIWNWLRLARLTIPSLKNNGHHLKKQERTLAHSSWRLSLSKTW